MKSRQVTMKQWRMILILVSSVIALLFILQISKLMINKSSDVGENVNSSRPKPVRILSSRRVSGRESSIPSPTTKKLSRKLQYTFRRNNSSKHLITIQKGSKLKNHKHFCWENEEFHIVGGCIRCSSYEKRVSTSCQETGNKQLVLCVTSNEKAYKSCPRVRWIEERNFWSFEGTMFVLLIISSISVWQRNKKLESVYQEKLRKKVSNDNS